MMVWQSMKMTEQNLKKNNIALNQKNRDLRVISEISSWSGKFKTREQVFTKYISLLCKELGWTQGLFFRLNQIDSIEKLQPETNAYHFIPNVSEFTRWKEVLLSSSLRDFEPLTQFGTGESNSIPFCDLISRIPSRVGREFDEILILRKTDGSSLSVEMRDFYREANTFVGQALDQIEFQRQNEANSAHLVAHSKMATLGEMAGGIAHEINNPLAVIGGRVAIMERVIKKDPIDLTKLNRDLDQIKNMVERISKIIKGLRIFSRNADADAMEPIEVEKIVVETLELGREKIRNGNIDLRVSVEPRLTVNCRPVQISQVLMNLIMNSHDAILHLEEKWITLEAKKTAGKAVISVTDSGPGIPEEVVSRLMQPFFTTKGPGKGTGLGLSISKGIIESHGGHLVYEPADGHTRFVISLPAEG
jgi:signal transduction histidine kinase